MPDTTTTSLPGVGAQVAYFASSVTEPMPAQIAQDLGAGRYNLRIVKPDGSGDPKPNVAYFDGVGTAPASGEYCMMAGAIQPK